MTGKKKKRNLNVLHKKDESSRRCLIIIHESKAVNEEKSKRICCFRSEYNIICVNFFSSILILLSKHSPLYFSAFLLKLFKFYCQFSTPHSHFRLSQHTRPCSNHEHLKTFPFFSWLHFESFIKF